MSDLYEALSEVPDDLQPPPEGEERERWTIAGAPPEARDRLASWAFRRLWLIEQERKRLEDSADAEVGRIRAWLGHALSPLDNDANFFRGALTEYLRAIRAERGEDPDNPKTTTYKLPTGTITGRKPPGRIEVLDEAAFIEWATTAGHEDLVRVKKEVDKVAIKRLTVAKDGVSVIIEGERVPFVEARRGPERLDAKPAAVEVDHRG